MTDTNLDLPAVLECHRKYLAGEAGGKRASLIGASLRGSDLLEANLIGANLSGADGVISGGVPNGWTCYGWLRDGWLSVRVGCREMRLAEGRAHWGGKSNRREVLAALGYIEAIAKIRKWRIK